LTLVIGCVIAVVPLGSNAAFLNLQNISNSGLLVSYFISIACRMHNRNLGSVWGNLDSPPPYYLGKTGGNVINTIALAVLIVFLVATMFPTAPNPTVSTMNWTSLALGATVFVAVVSYVWLRKDYLEEDHAVANIGTSENGIDADNKLPHSEIISTVKETE
jgi:choline transport protein